LRAQVSAIIRTGDYHLVLNEPEAKVRSMTKTFRAIATMTATTLLLMGPTLSGAATPTQSALTSELLALRQMPTGWSAGNATGDDGIGCLKGLLEPKGVRQTRSAQAYYLGTVN
jgi:hypothetical protein